VWIDTAVYGRSDDDRTSEWDEHACRRYAHGRGLTVVRTLLTSTQCQRPPLDVLRDQLRADDAWIVIVPDLGHIDPSKARTFAEIHSAASGTVYPWESFPDLGLDSIKGTGQDATDPSTDR
jgi:hypothetical protein